jgi:hypothetical protein
MTKENEISVSTNNLGSNQNTERVGSWEDLDREVEERLPPKPTPTPPQTQTPPIATEPIISTPPKPTPTPPQTQTPTPETLMDLDFEENIITDFYCSTFDILAVRLGEIWKLNDTEKTMLAKPTKKLLEKYKVKMTPEIALISSALVIVAPRLIMTSMAKPKAKPKPPTPETKPEPTPTPPPPKPEIPEPKPPIEPELQGAKRENAEQPPKNPPPTPSHEVLASAIGNVQPEVKK